MRLVLSIILGLIFLFGWSLCQAEAEDTCSPEKAIVLLRHGKRGPLSAFMPLLTKLYPEGSQYLNPEYNYDHVFPENLQELWDIGYEYGGRYDDTEFIIYPEDIIARSSGAEYSQESLEAFLQGFFDTNETDAVNSTFYNSPFCVTWEEHIADYSKILTRYEPQYQVYLQALNSTLISPDGSNAFPLLNLLPDFFDATTEPSDIWKLTELFQVVVRRDLELGNPPLAQFPEIFTGAAFVQQLFNPVWYYRFAELSQSALISHPLVVDILDFFNSSSPQKLMVLSAQVQDLEPLAVLLGLISDTNPIQYPEGAVLFLELQSCDNGSFVYTEFRGQEATVRTCSSNPCPLSEFIEAFEGSAELDFDALCTVVTDPCENISPCALCVSNGCAWCNTPTTTGCVRIDPISYLSCIVENGTNIQGTCPLDPPPSDNTPDESSQQEFEDTDFWALIGIGIALLGFVWLLLVIAVIILLLKRNTTYTRETSSTRDIELDDAPSHSSAPIKVGDYTMK